MQPAEAAERWSGPYMGINVGYGGADEDGSIQVFTGAVPIAHTSLNYVVETEGAFGGLQVGFNVRSGALLAGLEADVQLSDISGSSTTSFAAQPGLLSAFVYRASSSLNSFGTLRGRLGIASDNTMFYATGGLALGQLEYSANYLITGNNAFANLANSESKWGYVLGGGIEQALGKKWSLKLEYQYLNFGSQKAEGLLFFANGVPSGEVVKTKWDSEFHTIRLGLNYRFGG